MTALVKGIQAPDFDLPLLQGGRFNLREQLSKGPVVLAFFKVSCPVCQFAFPYYERLAKALAPTGVQVIGVSQDQARPTEIFAETYGLSFPIALDDPSRYAVSNAYGLTNVPTVFEIAQDGTIVLSSVGWAKQEVEEMLARYRNSGLGTTDPALFQSGEAVPDFRAG